MYKICMIYLLTARVAGWEAYKLHALVCTRFLGLDLPYKADPAQPFITAGDELL